MQFMRKDPLYVLPADSKKAHGQILTTYGHYSGCEPLTPDDIAEVVVFAAGRRENVVIADTLIFPSHQVSQTSHTGLNSIADGTVT